MVDSIIIFGIETDTKMYEIEIAILYYGYFTIIS